jgi:hypothetical protein
VCGDSDPIHRGKNHAENPQLKLFWMNRTNIHRNNNNNNSTRSGITNQISCSKNMTNKQITNADSLKNLMREWNRSASPILATEQYILRHDRVCAELHCKICKEIGGKLDNKCYDHVPKSVETSHEGKVTILWNQQLQTNRTVGNNKLDIIICDNKQGTCILIDVAIPGDRNVSRREVEKIVKYKDLKTEIQCMWNVKEKMIPVIIGATGTISKSLRQYQKACN